MSEQTTQQDAVQPVTEEEAPATGQSEETAEDTGSGTDEGDIAADYLEELLDIVDLDGDIEIEIRAQRTFISIQAEEGSEELQNLVGKKGEVLDALQELTRLAVLTATGQRTRLVLDINGYRTERNDELKKLAQDAVQRIEDSGEPVHMEPMSAFERKIVHDFIADAGLASESEGEGKRRHVVASAA